jgi:uncharacterized RDD family membrane protein YckC
MSTAPQAPRPPNAAMMNDIGWRRFGAWLVDIVFVSVVLIAVQLPFGWHFGAHYDATQRWILTAVSVVVTCIYAVPFVVRDGATPGKRLNGIRVSMLADGGAPDLWIAVLREVVLKVLALAVLTNGVDPALGALAFALDAGFAFFAGVEGRSLHDRIARTIVVRG